MADSRFAAIRLYIKKRWPLTEKLSYLVAVFLTAWFMRFVADTGDQPEITLNALFLLVFAAGLWITEAIPPFSVSLLIMGFAVYFLDDLRHFRVISEGWQDYLGTWSSPIIWILLGGFFLAMGAQVTQFDKKFSQKILSQFGTKPYNFLLGCMLTTGVLSMFMSNTATSAMMLAVVTPIAKNLDRDEPFLKALFIGIAAAATVGGMGTIIGSPPNAIAVGSLQNVGIDFGFSQWMIIGFPLAIFFIFLVWVLLRFRFKTGYTELPLTTSAPGEVSLRNTARNRVVVVATFIITIGLWLTTPLHDIPVAVVSYIPVVALTVTGVITAADLKLLPWDTLLLVAGGLTLGLAISNSELDLYLVSKIPVLDNPWVMLIILSMLTMILSNIMSNTATASILIPVGISFMPDQALLVALVIGFSASTALFLPISTPPNAIAFSTGYVKQSDFRYLGTTVGLAGPILIVLIAMISVSLQLFG